MYTCPSCNKGKLSAVSVLKSSLQGTVVCSECGEKLAVVQPKFIHILLLYMVFSFIIFHIAPGLVLEIFLSLSFLGIAISIVVFKTRVEKIRK